MAFSNLAVQHQQNTSLIQVTNVPDWVTFIKIPEFNKDDPYLEHFSPGHICLLIDTQVTLCEERKITFCHMAHKLTQQKALSSFNYIDIDYNPTFSEVQFHYVRIIRDGSILDVLDPTKINIILEYAYSTVSPTLRSGII